MKVSQRQEHLDQIRERFRVIHELNLRDLCKHNDQLRAHHLKLIEPVHKPAQHIVDVRV